MIVIISKNFHVVMSVGDTVRSCTIRNIFL